MREVDGGCGHSPAHSGTRNHGLYAQQDVFETPLRSIWTIVIGFCWLFGVTMQIAAGMIARLRKLDPAIG